MKRFAAFVLLTAMMLGMTACTNGTTEQPKGEQQQSTGNENTPAGEAKVIAYVPKTLNNPFFVAVKDNIESEAAKLGYEVVVNSVEAETEVDKQISIIETFIEQGVDAIICTPCSGTAIVDVVERSTQAGIPFFLVDTAADECSYKAFVGTDNFEGGKMAARWFGENVKGNMAILDGYSGNDATTQRVKGFMEEIANYPDITVLASEYGNCEISKGMEVAENFLVAYPDLTGIFCANDMMAIGAGQAAQAAGRKDGIKIMGFDGQPDTMEQIKNGVLDVTIAQKPATMGRMIVSCVDDCLNGKEIERIVDTGCEVVDASNADQYAQWQ